MKRIAEFLFESEPIYYADLKLRSRFVPIHHVYDSPKGQQPVRSEENERAYSEFIHALGEIKQLRGSAEATPLQLKTSEEQNQALDSYCFADSFREQLQTRALKNVYFGSLKTSQSESDMSSSSLPAIREETLTLLTSPPEPPYTLFGMVHQVVNVILLTFTVYQQMDAINSIKDAVVWSTRLGPVRRSDCLWAVLVLKEAFFLTVPLFALLAALARRAIDRAHAAAEAAAEAAEARDWLHPRARRLAGKGMASAVHAAKKKLEVMESLLLHLSSTWRALVLLQQLYRWTVNPSAKDFKGSLTMTSNLIYSMVLLSLQADGSDEIRDLTATLAINAFKLMIHMVTQATKIDTLCESLRDINENRLSKFELSLLMVKQLEMMLDEDVQFNFVEHMRSSEPLRPQAILPPCTPSPSSAPSSSPMAAAAAAHAAPASAAGVAAAPPSAAAAGGLPAAAREGDGAVAGSSGGKGFKWE